MIGVTVWIAWWSEQSKEEQDRTFYIFTLVILVLAAIIVSGIRSVLAFFAMVKVSTGRNHNVGVVLCLFEMPRFSLFSLYCCGAEVVTGLRRLCPTTRIVCIKNVGDEIRQQQAMCAHVLPRLKNKIKS